MRFSLFLCGVVGLSLISNHLSAQTTIPVLTPGQVLATSNEKVEATLKQLLKDSTRAAAFRPPNATEIANFKHLLSATIQQTQSREELRSQWHEAGWQLREVPSLEAIVILENKETRTGRGIYFLRPGSDSKIVLESPHRFYDRRTGLICRQLCAEGAVFAAAWNTIHRKQVDLAHQSSHFLNAFTEAIIEAKPTALIAQLHGFSDKDKNGRLRSAKLIVSDCSQFPARTVRIAAIELKELIGRKDVRLFPLEIRELGGTTNSQAAAANALGFARFLHLEMNAELRQQLSSKANLRSEFLDALILSGSKSLN